MENIVQLLRDFRARTKTIRGLPLPPNDDIGVSLEICDQGDAMLIVQVQGVPTSFPGEERIAQIVSGAPAREMAFFPTLDDALDFLRGNGSADWVLDDELASGEAAGGSE